MSHISRSFIVSTLSAGVATSIFLVAAATGCQPELRGSGTMLDRSRRNDAQLTRDGQGKKENPGRPSGPRIDPNNDPSDTSQPPKRTESQILFSAIDPLASPWRGGVFSLDPNGGEAQPLLTGESSDPAVFATGGTAWIFNRAADNSNMRAMEREPGRRFRTAQQMSFPGAGSGDPHDVVALSPELLLIANYVQGSLFIVEAASGRLKQVVGEDWDLPAGVQFHPESLAQVENQAGEKFIVVVHQALSLGDGGMSVNGSQQLFVLRQVGDQLSAVDMDESRPRIQGLKLRGSMPVLARFKDRPRPMFVSMCSRYLAAGDHDSDVCHAAVEELDLDSMKVVQLMNLDGKDLFMNGGVQPGWSDSSFFASVERKISENKFVMEVVEVETATQTVKTVYEYFEQRFGGFWAMISQPAQKRLFIGDMNNRSIGKFRLLVEGEAGSDIDLPLVPYSAAMVETPVP